MRDKAALATLALLASFVAPVEAQVDLTEIQGPLLYPHEPLEPHPTGILFHGSDLPDSPFGGPVVYRSGGTASTTRQLVIPGRPVHQLVGYRDRHVYLNAARTAFSPPTEVFSLDLRSAQARRLLVGRATLGTAAAPGFYFVLESEDAPGLYRTDATPAGTRRVFPGPITDVVSIGKAVLFWSPLDAGGGHALYRAAGTRIEKLGEFPQVVPFLPFEYHDPFPLRLPLPHFVRLGERAAFLQAGGGGGDLWISDGTASGTHLLNSASAALLWVPAPCGNELLFFRGDYPLELWATDGTLPGTRLLASAITDFLQQSFRVADAGGVCYFVTGTAGPAQLWRTDLTPAGTAVVASIDYQTGGLPPTRAAGARGRVFFPKTGELWVSDGTQDGTRPLAVGFPNAPFHLVHSAGHLFFQIPDSGNLPQSTLWSVHLPPALVVEDAEATEKRSGVGAMTFHVRLSRPSPTEVVVHYETEGGTAEPGDDFVTTEGTLRFAPGQRVKRVRVGVAGDGVGEGAEHFQLRLTDPVGAEVERGLAMGIIRDSDSNFPRPRR